MDKARMVLPSLPFPISHGQEKTSDLGAQHRAPVAWTRVAQQMAGSTLTDEDFLLSSMHLSSVW